jgi:hypothetical protein
VTDPHVRTFEIQPNTWWGKLLALAAAILLVALAVVFFTVFLGLLAAAVIAAPLLGWWRARQLRRGAPKPTMDGPRPGGPVIDVEYEIRDK